MEDRTLLLEAMGRAVLEGDDRGAALLARQAIAAGIPPLIAVEHGYVPGIRRAGELWEEGEYFLPELVGAAQAMKAAVALLSGAFVSCGPAARPRRVVIGTIQGDIHDIGKTLVAALLSAGGFDVTDLGVDVPVDRFVTRARELDADLVCASALLTTTMSGQRDLVEAVRDAGLRARVIVGGAPVTAEWARAIGAAGHADNAVAAVDLARGLVAK